MKRARALASLAVFALSPVLAAAPAPSPNLPPKATTTPAPAPGATPAPTPQNPPPGPGKPAPNPKQPDDWTEARKMFEQLSPDQQKRFLDNLDQWKAMSPEEQELFRDRDLIRREKIALEIQDSITKSGLKLDDDQREVYALRYTQERRKIEEELHKEMDKKRAAMVSDMLARLKIEFVPTPTPTPGSKPAQAK
jgi:hypothetical protein